MWHFHRLLLLTNCISNSRCRLLYITFKIKLSFKEWVCYCWKIFRKPASHLLLNAFNKLYQRGNIFLGGDIYPVWNMKHSKFSAYFLTLLYARFLYKNSSPTSSEAYLDYCMWHFSRFNFVSFLFLIITLQNYIKWCASSVSLLFLRFSFCDMSKSQ